MVSENSLADRRVLVTRAREQAETLVAALRERGAIPLTLPTIRFDPPDDWSAVDRAARDLDAYDWIVFTSANGVRFFFDRRAQLGTGEPVHASFAAIGPATARALEARGFAVAFVPSTYVAEAVVAEFPSTALEDRRVLLPRAREARDVLAIGLRAKGAVVDEVAVYQTRADGDPDLARRLFAPDAPNRPEVVTLTSSSTARQFVNLLGEDAPTWLRGVIVASIGPITSQTARELGLRVDVEASEHTIPGLVAALEVFIPRRFGAEVTP